VFRSLASCVFSVLLLRLVSSASCVRVSLQLVPSLRNIIGGFCHDLCARGALFFALSAILAPISSPQINRITARTDAPPADMYYVDAVTQEIDGPLRKLRGKAKIETSEMVLYADEIDYNDQTHYAEARGNVHFKHFVRNEEIWATKVEYDIDEEKGK